MVAFNEGEVAAEGTVERRIVQALLTSAQNLSLSASISERLCSPAVPILETAKFIST